jgi:hypothetical protein
MNGEPPAAGRTVGRRVRLLADPERGSAPPEIIWLILGQFVAVVGAVVLCTAYLGDPWIPVWLSWTLVAVPSASLLWWMTGVSALHRVKDRRNQRVLDEMGPRLAEWLDLRPDETLTDSMAAQWRQAVTNGLTQAEAQRWSDHGFSYTVAAAALQARVSLPEVEAIAAEVRRGGGAAVDRRWAMADVLTMSRWPGWYSWRSWSILFNDPTVALRSWGHIPLHAIAPAVGQALARCWSSCDVGDETWKELAGFRSY